MLKQPTDTPIDAKNPELISKFKIDSQTEYYATTNNKGTLYFDLTADRNVINYADPTPIMNANMSIAITLKKQCTQQPLYCKMNMLQAICWH